MTDAPPLPPRLSIEQTARCNFACPFCYGVWHERPEWGEPELPSAEWAAILADYARRGVKSVQFTGGEPLLRDDLDELCDRALAVGLKVAVYTNASLLTEEHLLSFKRRGVRLLTSLQGIKSHAEMTGTDHGPWPTLEAIERAREIGWPMGVGIPVARKNAFVALDLVAAALLAGASVGQVGPAMWEGRMKSHSDDMLDADEWAAIKEKIRALPPNKGKIVFPEEFFCACREQPPEAVAKWPAQPKNCPAGKSFGVLGVDGQVPPLSPHAGLRKERREEEVQRGGELGGYVRSRRERRARSFLRSGVGGICRRAASRAAPRVRNSVARRFTSDFGPLCFKIKEFSRFFDGNLMIFIRFSASFWSPEKVFPSAKNPSRRRRAAVMASARAGSVVRVEISGASGKSHSRGTFAGAPQRVLRREASFSTPWPWCRRRWGSGLGASL